MKKVLKPEAKLGAEPKKIAMLGGLLAVLAVVWFINRSPDSTVPTTTSPAAGVVLPGGRAPVGPVNRTKSGVRPGGVGGRGLSAQEFHPSLKPKDGIDMAKVDPTLRLPLLAKLGGVRVEGGERSLFEFSTAPAAAAPIAKVEKIIPKPLQNALATGPVREKAPAAPPAPPPPPPIPLKFYGYTNAQRAGANKKAFFLEGEDIYVAGEGDTIKNRYRIVRIGVNSAVVEDTQFKNQQTLPLVEEMANS
jgi:hypothetical protein